MLSTLDVITLFALAVAGGYWFAATRAREIARHAGRRACAQAEVQFLDDTVELTRLRLRRDERGQIVLYREYRFEFSYDNTDRHRGALAMLGSRVVSLRLAP